MKQYKRYIPIVALILVALGVNLDKFGIDLEQLANGGSGTSLTSSQQSGSSGSKSDSSAAIDVSGLPHWSSTNPEINLKHVFAGEINRKGKPTGFHSRPGGNDPATAKLLSVRDQPNSLGIYTATIAVRDGDQWKEKFSSFFPDHFSQQDVIDAVINAYNNSSNPKAQPWQGPSGHGFAIQGYTTNRGGINTAFPVFVGSQ
ncbi:MAG: EndoU domain-containing protein [Gammaproteobacteria bacterium]|nr:EndoU domain-containing protein [Gammaproteobacteria bacterium]